MSAYLDKLMGTNEKPVFMTRKHVIVIARALIYGIFVSAVIIAGGIFAGTATAGLGFVLLALVVLPIWQMVRIIVRWQNEEYIVTNRRVMKLEGVINKHVIDSSLEKVNDVVLDQTFLGRVFNYGDVEILTGSDIGVNKFDKIANPVDFKREMLNAKEALGHITDFGTKEQRILEGPAPSKGDIPELIAELDELRKKGILSQEEFETKKADLLKRL